ncbi:PREDICTED: F-box protein At5g49610-like [Camelina sativa]|uniref:F-box protein At5g49610-like n=1 Tax=Camelina sativa TaxID=90675 RepID=A0ABM0U5I5_CAMSA|nr:PREDICTED: F-box protein At5g49610-like [Camelina sativa]XP_010496896.1 PREDICTED: F-box protein At5g49610-like [Camelina sativa]
MAMMNNSPTTMMNEDVMLEIMSYCPATEMAKFRLLNKECNKRSYELSFINRNLHRTNSFFGYIFLYREVRNKKFAPYYWYHSSFVSAFGSKEKNRISLALLPRFLNNADIKACDTHHGILLCIKDDNLWGRIPGYIVCKPATKQYRLIPNPETRFHTVATGLMVVSSNPFRCKIIRVSRDGDFKLSCEVYDSDSDAWNRLSNLKFSGFFLRMQPVSAYGCLHWLTEKNNVMRFCMRTETWSTFPVPDELVDDDCLLLVSYEGKLGVIHSRWREGSNIWVLEKSFGTSWVRFKDVKIKALEDDISNEEPIWLPSNDTISRAASGKLGLYNMSNDNYRYLYTIPDFYYYLPFYSNFERVCLHKDDVE